MKLPSFKVFEMNSLLDEEAPEDIVCRICEKVIIPKGDMMSSVNKTTHYPGILNELTGKWAWSGKNEYSCHDCEPPNPNRRLQRPWRCTRGKAQ